MTSEKHNLPDDILDQATQALRGTPIPPGPPPEVLQRILDAPSRDLDIARSIRLRDKVQVLRPLFKIAAVLVIVLGTQFASLAPDGNAARVVEVVRMVAAGDHVQHRLAVRSAGVAR